MDQSYKNGNTLGMRKRSAEMEILILGKNLSIQLSIHPPSHQKLVTVFVTFLVEFFVNLFGVFF